MRKLLLGLLLTALAAPSWGDPTFVAAGTGADGTGTIAPGLPAGWAADDVHILVVKGRGADGAQTITPGFTEIAEIDTGDGGDDVTCEVSYRVAVGGDSAPTVPDSGNSTFAQIYGFRDVDTADVLAGTAVTSSSGFSPTFTITGMTTDENGAMFIGAVCNGNSESTSYTGWTNGDLASITEAGEHNGTSGSDGSLAAAYGIDTTAGAVGNTTGSKAGGNSINAMVSFALKGAATSSVTYDADNYDLGDTITASTSGMAALESITNQTSSDVLLDIPTDTFIACPLDELTPAGDCNNTPLETSHTWRASDGALTADDTFTLDCPGFCGTLTCDPDSNCPGDSLAEAASDVDVGDDYLCRYTTGGGLVGPNMIPAVSFAPADIECRNFDVTSTIWDAAFSTNFTQPAASSICDETVSGVTVTDVLQPIVVAPLCPE